MSSVTDRAREALSDTEFPADRNTLLVRATEHGGAADDVLHALTVLPEGTYGSLDAVVAGLGADHERGDDEGAPTSGRPDVVRDDD
ncbi:DUF2795 domain-containing protein [Actinomycetospora sp. TBRC 11914]|uniref:DUF2795 domain-containing protein n=1 Tax=Actinomycetospora sp. TBRC 11914 TaxID=2729387 RepID=UPI00145D14A6|nr:DUF2795 domain-containing protein [Actinomycetospora sp. TBRC 11914]NMO93860.1 DUF2795 domain-containing protein [Actinomycetospora sp. TBRC 11914]